MIGTLINNRYRIDARLGEGRMGAVYRAHDVRLDRAVALKFISGEDDPTALERFHREARAISRLNHANIMALYDMDEADGHRFLVTELIPGRTLATAMSDLSHEEKLSIALQVAETLAYAHRQGVVHRDLKPSNIMLIQSSDNGADYTESTRAPTIKLMDFGLALILDASRLTGTGVVGTVRYMAPEQAIGGELSGSVDLYALGVILYEMFTGDAPFYSSDLGGLIHQILNITPRSPQTISPDIPPQLNDLILLLLRKQSDERPANADQVVTELRRLQKRDDFERIESYECNHHIDPRLEPVGGAVPLGSPYYVVRSTDQAFTEAMIRRDSIVLVKGARQIGKTSLLARGLQKGREMGSTVALTDFQTLNAAHLESVDSFLFTLAESLADQIDLDVFPDQVWDSRRSANMNFQRYIRREVMAKIPGPIVWGLDEVDRLFTCSFGSEVFGLFRSWHNARSLDPRGPWSRVTLAIAYATEAHLFITDLNQSPFNVGTRLELEDFTFEQVSDINSRYDAPLRDDSSVRRYFGLVGGHPYLVRCGLHVMSTQNMSLSEFEHAAVRDEGPFGDHLRRIIVLLAQDPDLREVVRGVLRCRPCPTAEGFYRLRSAGLLSGDSAQDARFRCPVYATYLKGHL